MQGIVIAALLLTPSGDRFCDDLGKVVAALPGEFATLAGNRVGGSGDTRYGRVRPHYADGPSTCLIALGRHIAGTRFQKNYHCFSIFEKKPDAQQVMVLADRVAKCFAGTAVPTKPPTDEVSMSITAGNAEIVVTVEDIIPEDMVDRGNGAGAPTHYALIVEVRPAN